jgi:hypothetical protein
LNLFLLRSVFVFGQRKALLGVIDAALLITVRRLCLLLRQPLLQFSNFGTRYTRQCFKRLDARAQCFTLRHVCCAKARQIQPTGQTLFERVALFRSFLCGIALRFLNTGHTSTLFFSGFIYACDFLLCALLTN